MYISAREREIIELLLNNNQGISIQEIAKQIQVSSRTIQREIKGVERILTSHSLIIKKRIGNGLTVEGNQDLIDEIQITLLSMDRELSPSERREQILCKLLKENEPIKLITFANELNVTVATVSNDLTRVEKWLMKFALKPIRKKGFGITLQGSEKQRRKALGALITEKLNEYEFLEAIENYDNANENKLTNQLLEFIKLDKIIIVGKIIRDLEKQLSYSLADTSYMSLTIHLSLALERMMQGEIIKLDPGILIELKQSKEFMISNQIAKELEAIFLIKILEVEKGYITMHLQGSRLRHKNNDWIEKVDLAIVAGTKKLVQHVSLILNINFEKDKHLFEGLLTDIEPTIYRIEKKLELGNPFNDQIRKDYPYLFKAIQEGLEIAFPTITFPDYESTYLVMHFASSQEIDEVGREISVLAICSNGMGSSKLLASRLKKEIKEITSVDSSALYHLKQIDIDCYDLILSTIEMPGFSRKYLQVNPLLTNEDIERIRKEIKLNLKTKFKKEEGLFKDSFALNTKNSESSKSLKEKIENINIYSKTALHIINTFETFNLITGITISSSIKEVCDKLLKKRLITQSESVVQQLLQRQELGGLGIPETELALYHCCSEHVHKPLFLSAKLPEPLLLNSMNGANNLVTKLFILLAPLEPHPIELDLLSSISSSIIENDKTIQLFTTGDDQEIIQTLMSVFEIDLKQKIKS